MVSQFKLDKIHNLIEQDQKLKSKLELYHTEYYYKCYAECLSFLIKHSEISLVVEETQEIILDIISSY